MIKAIEIDKLKANKCYKLSEFEEDALVEIDIISGEYCGTNGNPPIKAIDVIQKEKIDKAIEKMNLLAAHKIRPISFDQSVAIDMCINILKSNIGENNR